MDLFHKITFPKAPPYKELTDIYMEAGVWLALLLFPMLLYSFSRRLGHLGALGVVVATLVVVFGILTKEPSEVTYLDAVLPWVLGGCWLVQGLFGMTVHPTPRWFCIMLSVAVLGGLLLSQSERKLLADWNHAKAAEDAFAPEEPPPLKESIRILND